MIRDFFLPLFLAIHVLSDVRMKRSRDLISSSCPLLIRHITRSWRCAISFVVGLPRVRIEWLFIAQPPRLPFAATLAFVLRKIFLRSFFPISPIYLALHYSLLFILFSQACRSFCLLRFLVRNTSYIITESAFHAISRGVKYYITVRLTYLLYPSYLWKYMNRIRGTYNHHDPIWITKLELVWILIRALHISNGFEIYAN